jgi:hypothetical protein
MKNSNIKKEKEAIMSSSFKSFYKISFILLIIECISAQIHKNPTYLPRKLNPPIETWYHGNRDDSVGSCEKFLIKNQIDRCYPAQYDDFWVYHNGGRCYCDNMCDSSVNEPTSDDCCPDSKEICFRILTQAPVFHKTVSNKSSN